MKLEEQLAERQKGKQQQEAPDPKIKELEEACQKQTEEHTALRVRGNTILCKVTHPFHSTTEQVHDSFEDGQATQH
jgi:hypothetical protein